MPTHKKDINIVRDHRSKLHCWKFYSSSKIELLCLLQTSKQNIFFLTTTFYTFPIPILLTLDNKTPLVPILVYLYQIPCKCQQTTCVSEIWLKSNLKMIFWKDIYIPCICYYFIQTFQGEIISSTLDNCW